MDMNKEDEVALEESISDWKKKARVGYIYKVCPLCTLGKKRNKSDICKNCIIRKHTGLKNCNNTPLWPRGTSPNYYQHEIEFLESLRPEKKVKEIIEIGDEVYLVDSNWALRLENGKTYNVYEILIQRTYTVAMTGTCLPEGESHTGLFGNDTILYEPKSGNYVFTREKYLKLVEPKHCSECGKAK